MNFLYLSTLFWDEAGGAHNPTQISRALARRGHRVLFVEPQPSAARETKNLPIEIVALTELGMTPAQLRRAWYGLDSGELGTVAQNLIACANRSATAAPRVAIFSAPFEPFVRLFPILRANRYSIVYYAMDDFAAAPALGYTQFLPAAQEYLTRNADGLVGVTPHIAQSLERFGKRAHVIPNGIDLKEFAPSKSLRSVPLRRGKVTLGYWGTLMDSMFDADLVAHVAATHPRWMIHLLGAYDPEPHRPSVAARLESFSNIIFHGAVPHADLPRYAAAFDVCLAPFPDNDFTRGRDPIKIYEYLAAHKPVAASYTPQLASLPYVHVAYSPEEFVQAIEEAACDRVDTRALDNFLAPQSWDARAGALLTVLSELPAPSATAESVLLPSWGAADTGNWARYVNGLERELEEIQGWAQELEAQLLAQERTLQRIVNFPVTRLWRRVRSK